MKNKYSIINNVLFLLRDIYGENKILFLYILIESIFGIFNPLFGIYLPKLVVQLVTQNANIETIIIKFGLFILTMTLSNSSSNMASSAKYMHYNNLRFTYLYKLFFKSLECGYDNIESSEGQIKYEKARACVDGGDGSGTSVMTISMIAIFISVINFILYSGIISTLNPLIMILLIGLTLINYFAQNQAIKYEESKRDDESNLRRKLSYIENASGDITAGKDVRLYGMEHWFKSIRDNILHNYIVLYRKIKNRYFISALTDALTLMIRDIFAYGYLIWMTLQGDVTIDNFVLYFGAITGLSSFIRSIISNINSIKHANVQLNDMREFLEMDDDVEEEDDIQIPPLNSILTISFRNVCFSYDGKSNVINNFNLEIKAGEKIALVGVNGAGKTTLVKLLCKFYQPDSGEILINDININRFKKRDLYKLFSAIFQDIVLFPFTVAENVSMTSLKQTDRNKVEACLIESELNDDVKKYEKYIDSKMLKNIDESGVVFSGGQQQKLLLSRALYKNAPILLLDEPTAALDPIAESKIYEKFHAMTKNKTAIYISHRLASTRFCDRIIFLKNGTIYEIGSHEELINKNGEYANMFNIQSHYYKEHKDVDENEKEHI